MECSREEPKVVKERDQCGVEGTRNNGVYHMQTGAGQCTCLSVPYV